MHPTENPGYAYECKTSRGV